MKKTLLSLIAMFFLVSMVSTVRASDLPKPVDKLAKGAVEIVKSPMAAYDHTKATMDGSKYKLLGLFKGLIMAPFHVVEKAGHGALSVATFPIE